MLSGDGSMVWLILWVVSMAFFLFAPCIVDVERRERWYRRIFMCQWRASPPSDSDSVNDTQYTYVLSRQQEDGIRESYMLERLNPFSVVVKEDMIKSISLASGDSASTASNREDDSISDGDAVDDALEDIESQYPARPSSNESDDEYNVTDDELVMTVDEYVGAATTFVCLPESGDAVDAEPVRRVPNGCAICLSVFAVGERICWSNNELCCHCFHHECILDWLLASGRKHLKKQRRREQRERTRFGSDPIEAVTMFPKLCPCCRQDFSLDNNAKDDPPKEIPSSSDEEDEHHEAPEIHETPSELVVQDGEDQA